MKTSSYFAFYLMAIIIIFNLNGMLYMLVGVLQLMTPFLIICIGILTLNMHDKFTLGLGAVGKIYAAVTLAYLLIGFFAAINNNVEPQVSYIVTNIISLITIMSIAAFTYNFYSVHGRSFINPIFYMVFLSSCSIPLSPFLLLVYKLPPAEIARGFGFFANPNEGGILSVIGLGLLIAATIPRYLKVIFYLILFINTVLTFSKSSILLFAMVSIGVYLSSEIKIKLRYSLVIFAVIALASFSVPKLYDNLGLVQKRRIDQIVAIAVQGEINADSTSGRSELWELGLGKINDHPFIGNGLGELHHMKNGIASLGVDQGVHNVYLMFWGEAGIFVLFGFIFFCIIYVFNWIILRKTMPKELLTLTLVSFICLFADMMSAHNVLNLRMHNFFLGLSFGYFSYFNKQLNKIKRDSLGKENL
jgi:O-antigen ligase